MHDVAHSQCGLGTLGMDKHMFIHGRGEDVYKGCVKMFYLIFRCEEPVPRAERWCDPLCIKSSCWVGRGEGGVVQPVGTGARGAFTSGEDAVVASVASES